MNLKRLCGIATVALTMFAAVLIAGCSNSMAGSVDGEPNARMATLTLSATGIPNDYAEQFAKSYPTAAKTIARSITPNDPYDVSDTTLTFKLSGKSETGKVESEKQVYLVDSGTTTTGDSTGKAIYNFYSDNAATPSPVTLDAMSWNLKLVAYNSAGGAVLQGFCSVDLRTGSGTAKFTMGTEGLDTEGSVTISGTFVDTDEASKYYTMGIYRKDTGELVTDTLQNGNTSVSSGESDFSYIKTSIAPGTYLYTMIFYAGTDATSSIVGSFTDTLAVNPGNDLVRTLKIDVIGRKPQAPDEPKLMAYLVNGTDGQGGNPTYNVKVEWEKFLYATNYELQVLEYKETGTNDTYVLDYETTDELKDASANNWIPTIYGMRSMDPVTDDTKAVKNFASSTVYGTGDGASYMMFGDTSCNLSLETGKIYEIRLRGRNYIGVSKFVERIASSDYTDADNNTKKFTGFGVADDKKDHINRLLVTYHLNGGTLEHKVGEATPTKCENTYAEYKSWKPSLTDTKLVESAKNSEYYIENSGSTFDSWLFEKGEGLQVDGEGNETPIKSTDPNDVSKNKVTNFTYKNLTVLASYGNKVTGNITMDAKLEDLELSTIKVYLNNSSEAENPTKLEGTDNNKVTLNKYAINKLADDGTSTTVTIVLDGDDATDKYKDVSFTLIDAQNKQKTLPIDRDKKRTCSINLESYPVGGKIQVMISAVTNKMTTVSQTLIFELQ